MWNFKKPVHVRNLNHQNDEQTLQFRTELFRGVDEGNRCKCVLETASMGTTHDWAVQRACFALDAQRLSNAGILCD